VSLPKRTLNAVATSPKSYYVDIHTRKNPNGALRGRLHAGG
jgi:hypothetical protein